MRANALVWTGPPLDPWLHGMPIVALLEHFHVRWNHLTPRENATTHRRGKFDPIQSDRKRL